MALIYRREYADEDLEAEALLVPKAVFSALDDSDLRVSENALDHRLGHMAEEPACLRATLAF
jgi:hypothetical protein